MTRRRILTILFTISIPVSVWAQLVVVGIPHSDNNKKSPGTTARTKALELPFWDDFSSTRTTYANPELWFYNRSIRVNDGLAIRPPSIRVATFDGVDSVGKPYNVNDVLAKGYADKLESNEIDLTIVDPADRNSVYLSYAYQMKGHGETPDAGDRILVSFKAKDNIWVPVDTVENDGTLLSDVFYTSFIKVADEKYYHEDFKFRIQNFSRLSGPYDTWNIDYIYLNKGRTANDISFPDRTISEPMTSLFGIYTMMPLDHYYKNPAALISKPSILATNQRVGNLQPVNLFSRAVITYRQNKIVTRLPSIKLDSAAAVNEPLAKGEFKKIEVTKVPDLTNFSSADSVGIELIVALSTGDNIIFDGSKGDYDPVKYDPIDFRFSDTTRSSFLLLNKYAYDDGVAEYGVGLNQPGAQVAYEYNLVGVTNEFVTFLEMYFPRFGDESSQVMELRIWDNLEDPPIYTGVTTLQRSAENIFWTKQLSEPIPVRSKFYIGWRQSTSAVIAAGLDKSSNTGAKLFYNTNGEWVQNTLVQGSMMIRPVFGVGGPIGLEDEKSLTLYPNPSTGTFNFAGEAQRILVYDMTGRAREFDSVYASDETRVTIHHATPGIYIMKVYQDGTIRTAKVLVRE